MKKTLLLVGALCVLGTTAFGATKINSEIRVIDAKNGTDKIEYTIAEGNTDIAENLKFYFDVDLDTEYAGSNRDKYWDTDWRLGYTVPQEILDHKLTVSYEIDADFDYAKDSIKGADASSFASDIRFEFAKDNYYIAPSFNFSDSKMDDGYLQLDVAFSAAGPLGTDVWFESYNYFDQKGHETWETDLEIYVSKTIPFYGINLKPELGYEGYSLMTAAKKDSSVYVQFRVDKSFDVSEGFVVTPYAQYVDYTRLDNTSGSADKISTEFGVETTMKF